MSELPTAYVLSPQLVAFLDLVGQGAKLLQLRIPKTAAEYAATEEVMRNTVGIVIHFRESFDKQFKGFEAGVLKNEFGQTERFRPRFLGLSDSFLVSADLRNEEVHLDRLMKVFSVLQCTAAVMLESFAQGHALRGGMDVGPATELAVGEVYGAALVQAYHLESRLADYPRVLIGDGLWNYLAGLPKEFEKLPATVADAMKNLLAELMMFIGDDVDGRKILNYLGPAFARGATDEQREVLVGRAYEFVIAEYKKWVSNGDTKLAGRYAVLRRYFEDRLHLWGMKPSSS